MTRSFAIQFEDLPQELSLFPLTGALLLPNGQLPLNIFEPRYLNMVMDALAGARLIGMVQPSMAPGRKDPDGLQTIGCVGRVTQMSETEDGRYMITLTGISRFRITREVEGFTPYRCCEVNWDGFERDLGGTEADEAFNRKRFLETLDRYFEARGLSADWATLKDADDELLINSLSMLLEFEPEDKQALLEAPSLPTRRETLVTLIEFALRGGTAEEIMQ